MTTYLLSNLRDFIKSKMSINQIVQYFIRRSGARAMFRILLQLAILCASTVKHYYAKIIIHWYLTRLLQSKADHLQHYREM